MSAHFSFKRLGIALGLLAGGIMAANAATLSINGQSCGDYGSVNIDNAGNISASIGNLVCSLGTGQPENPEAAPKLSLSGPATVNELQPATFTVNLSKAHSANVTVPFSVTSGSAHVDLPSPASVTIPAGSVSGTFSITSKDVTGNQSYTVTLQDPGVSGVELGSTVSRTVAITDIPASGACQGEAGVNYTYERLEDFTFPSMQMLKPGEVFVVKFCSAETVAPMTRGNFTSVESTTGTAIRSLTLSKVKGDRGATLSDACKKYSMTTSLNYQVGGSSISKCALEPGQTYYLNLFYETLATPTAAGTNTCSRAAGCGFYFYHYRNP